MTAVPQPLVIKSTKGVIDARVEAYDDARCDRDRTHAFGAALADARTARGLLDGPVRVLATSAATDAIPAAIDRAQWIPHVYAWEQLNSPAIAWELVAESRIPDILGTDAAAVQRWSQRPALLLQLAAIAARQDAPSDGAHLSLRWILSHETNAAAALSGEQVTLEHVSIHVTAAEEQRLVGALVDGLGLVEVPRPPQIATPGRWLQAGAARIHLSTRAPRPHEPGFPATAPNHICLAVADLDRAVAAFEAAGLLVTRAGSLGSQAWLRLSSGTSIELQQRR